jgi:hypothetical protein
MEGEEKMGQSRELYQGVLVQAQPEAPQPTGSTSPYHAVVQGRSIAAHFHSAVDGDLGADDKPRILVRQEQYRIRVAATLL